MPQPPDWKRVLETGMHFTELRRSQAHRLAIDLVAQGQLARDQIGAAVDELIEISRRRSEELRAIVSTEVQRQLGVLGLATKRDLDALEKRLRAAGRGAARAGAGKAPAKKKATAKPTASKVPTKKKAATKRPAKKAVASKSAARRTTAKRTAAARAARKTTGTRRAVKKAARKPAAKRSR